MEHSCQSLRSLQRIAPLAFALLLLTACSNGEKQVNLDASKNLTDVWRAATVPLDHLNLRNQEIPPLLKTAAQNPYAPPLKLQCKAIVTELVELNTILGDDIAIRETPAEKDDSEGLVASLDSLTTVPDMPTQPELADQSATLLNKGVETGRSQILDFIRDQTDILPFRSIIRRISGADRHAKKVQFAYEAGQLRRAYLKGVAQVQFGKRCDLAAANKHVEVDTAVMDMKNR